MRTLISGGTSSLGIALEPVLSEFGEVMTAGRKNCDIPLDLSDPVGSMHIPVGLDVIIHTAANFGGKTDAEIFDAETINAFGTLKLCQLAVKMNAKHFILISSMSSCLDEKSDYYGIYALSKKHAEELARFYCLSHFLPLTVLRPSQIYGSEESFGRHQPFFYGMIDKAERGEDIVIYGSRDPQRNYIHIDDLTSIISKVAVNRIEGVYSCMHPKNVTFSEIARAAISAFKSRGRIRFMEDKADIPDNIFEKNNALYEQINFYPRISIEDGMKRIANHRRVSS